MMMKTILLIFLLPALGWAQPFQFRQEFDTIPVVVDGDTLPAAWTGGYNFTSPALVDIEGDGDFDIILGQGGSPMGFWQNAGNALQESFQLSLGGLSLIGLQVINNAFTSPVFVDIDNDTDMDLILCAAFGGGSGMALYTNIGSTFSPYFQLAEDSLRDTQGNLIYGTQHDLADIDSDGDYDLFVGEWYTGRIHFYRNIGSQINYAFQLQDSYFSGVQAGYWSSPEFCDIDADGDLDMFVGNQYGYIWYYRNDGTPQQWNFVYVTNNWLSTDVGERASPEFCDIDDDGDYDLFLGKGNDTEPIPPGAVHFWRNLGNPQIAQFALESQMYLTLDMGTNSEPHLVDANFNSIDDFFILAYYLGWLKNVGTLTDPCFQLQSYNTAGQGFIAAGMSFGDLNGDSFQDFVMIYSWSALSQIWINNGDTTMPSFSLYNQQDLGDLAGQPVFGDLDGDGDLDLVLGVYQNGQDNLRYYENQGSSLQFDFVLVSNNFMGLLGACVPFAFIDFDFDSDLDIMGVGGEENHESLWYWENIGTSQQMILADPIQNILGMNIVNSGIPTGWSDIDNDNDVDLFTGISAGGGLYFFRNITGESPVHPDPKRPAPTHPVITLLPNPGNSTIAASYKLQSANQVSLKVFDITGRLTGTLFYGFQLPGTYSFSWDAASKAAGVYMLRLEAGGKVEVAKTIVVK
jgi:hypothetical protein